MKIYFGFWVSFVLLCLVCQVWATPLDPNDPNALNVGLCITEIMYHPADPPKSDARAEFIELSNLSPNTIDLNDFSLSDGIEFVCPDYNLPPKASVLIVEQKKTFESVYRDTLPILGEFQGRLSNSGETIRLWDAQGKLIQSIRYDDAWYPSTDGEGYSLVRAPDANDLLPMHQRWEVSCLEGGTPGWTKVVGLPSPGEIVINEILAHSHDEEPDWVELHNTTARIINLAGWSLSDNETMLTKYNIAPETVIDPCSYLVFYEDLHFGNPDNQNTQIPFALSDDGETFLLSFQADEDTTGYRLDVPFGASKTGVSFGPWTNSQGVTYWIALSQSTPGLTNAPPYVGPIIINEVMYHPAEEEDTEYIEIVNISTQVVSLYNTATKDTWRLIDNPNDPALDLRFTSLQDIDLMPGEIALLVRNRTEFLKHYTIPQGMQIFPWNSGSLSNKEEDIHLYQAGEKGENGEQYWYEIDRLTYTDQAPWPESADGNGDSLHRKNRGIYSNDPNAWEAAPPTPGQL